MEIFRKFLNDPEFDQINNMVRWNGVSRIKDETVAHHSYIVAWLSRVIAEEMFDDDSIKLKIVSFALFHDFDEMFTGDVLNPFKYNSFNGVEIRNCIDEFLNYKIKNKFNSQSNSDKMFRELLLKDFPDYVSKIVKVSDWFSMYFYLVKEIKLGNKGVDKQREFCIQSIKIACDDCIETIKKLDLGFKVNLDVLEEIKNLNFYE
jgi:5'-deoxynucleotidase YfbR-like HD superfamily hydrolase